MIWIITSIAVYFYIAGYFLGQTKGDLKWQLDDWVLIPLAMIFWPVVIPIVYFWSRTDAKNK